jgi:hypothetical protein
VFPPSVGRHRAPRDTNWTTGATAVVPTTLVCRPDAPYAACRHLLPSGPSCCSWFGPKEVPDGNCPALGEAGPSRGRAARGRRVLRGNCSSFQNCFDRVHHESVANEELPFHRTPPSPRLSSMARWFTECGLLHGEVTIVLNRKFVICPSA